MNRQAVKDIKWLVNRLQSMNVLEILWRVQQKFLQKIEYRKYFCVHLPVTEIELPKELSGLELEMERLCINRDNQKYQLFEKLDIFGMFDYQIYKKQWNAGFQTEKKWPKDKFSYQIIVTGREDIGDIRTNWELNRHFQFVGLAKNYYVTGNLNYFEELQELFEDWNQNNLFLHGVQWISAMEVAIRVVSWAYMYVFLEEAFRKREEERNQLFLNKVEHGIKVMADYILRYRARYSSANNHLIVEMLGVGVAGILFNCDKWINTAVKVLTRELKKQNSADGINREMSLHYQCFVMEAYGILWLLMKKNNIGVPHSWTEYLSPMSRFVADCCGDYGETIVFGDNDEGKVLDFCGKINDYYRYVLQLMGLLLECRYTDVELVENIYWLADEKMIRNYQGKELYKPRPVQFYQQGGYTILRSKDHKVLIGFDHAQLGLGSIAAHAHADALSIQVFYEGKPILVDPGTFNYHMSKRIRNDIRKTAAHNTVYVRDIEQAEMLGPFLWGKRYKVISVECLSTKDTVKVSAAIEYASIIHSRLVEFDRNRSLSITDSIDGEQEAYQIWNVAPRLNLEQLGFTSDSDMAEEKGSIYSSSYCSRESMKQYYIKLRKNVITTRFTLHL